MEKPLSEEQWAAGYKVQLLLGPDANNYNTSGAGLIGGSTKSSDFSLKDAYVALRVPLANGIDFKVGSFTTVVGYESFETHLRALLRERFGDRWFAEPEAGAVLREWWSRGQAANADELLAELTGARLDFSVLLADLAVA